MFSQKKGLLPVFDDVISGFFSLDHFIHFGDCWFIANDVTVPWCFAHTRIHFTQFSTWPLAVKTCLAPWSALLPVFLTSVIFSSFGMDTCALASQPRSQVFWLSGTRHLGLFFPRPKIDHAAPGFYMLPFMRQNAALWLVESDFNEMQIYVLHFDWLPPKLPPFTTHKNTWLSVHFSGAWRYWRS